MGMLAAWLLPRYAAGALPRPLARLVRRALDEDVELAASYDALRTAERALAGEPALTAGQLEVILGDVLDSVDAERAHAAAAGKETWGLALLGAAACAAFVVVGAPAPPVDAARRGDVDGLGDLTARGAHASEPLGVRVRCVDDHRVFDEATAGARQRGADLECGPGALLAFSTTNLGDRPRWAFVVGVDDEGGRVWLGPFSPAADAAAIAPGVVDVVLDRLAPMEALPPRVTLHVLLSDAPFSGADVERRLAAAVRSAVPLGRLDRLPVDVDVQSHLTLYRLP